MRFPDSVTIRRSTGPDEYANPASDPGAVAETSTVGFWVTEDSILLPPDTVFARRDRIVCRGRLLEVAEAEEVRSPAKTVLWIANVKEVPA